ncbi:hypothetical protein [Argonema galeatum]|uniref:hypothetical protein n=1 Tax=Argonema galeatum TaxID=2942762 RepID=UPI0020133830|nr:hypothetical protein [Argonema galeatum]MCL1467088.1 hypothetical protein [Argonema galeatum A003/A1]
MIDVSKLTLEDIRLLGIDALSQALGPAGMARFMQQFEMGSGDYTRDRDKLLGNPTFEEIAGRIKERRRQQAESSNAAPPKFTKMIDVTNLTQAQIRQMGTEALTKALGIEGMKQFMQKSEMESRDYRQDRDENDRNPSHSYHLL